MTKMEQEIGAQAAALKHTAEVNAAKIAALADEIKKKGIGQIMVAAAAATTRATTSNICARSMRAFPFRSRRPAC